MPTREIRITGRITVHPRGFGFLTAEPSPSGEVISAFITPPDLNPFLADDLVSAELEASADGRWTARSLVLVERPRGELFGEVVQRRGQTFLRTDREVANTDWRLDGGGNELRVGETVVGRIALPESPTAQELVFSRRITETEDFALEQVIARHGLRTDFSPDALAEARTARAIPHALGARRDLRAIPTVTIDDPSTRDIDDAIAVLPAGPDGALRLLVSIADASAFITEGSALDRAARDRATSVYLAGRVIPMLPEELSTHWISLLPGEDRFCLTVELRIDPEGHITATDVGESVIRSWARLNYEEVAEFLDHNRVSPALEPVKALLPWLRTALARLSLSRARRGGVEMSREDTHIAIDPQTGLATHIESHRPNSAHALIERFMVAANEAIAAWLFERGAPAVYRVHDEPDPQRVADLAEFAHNFGFEAGFGRKLTPLALAAFDAQVAGASCEAALRSVLLRALGQARYTVSPLGHFGLGAPLYLHFTSPIRRYADLAVHRIIKRYLGGDRHFVADDPEVEKLASHINRRARSATRAENDRRRVLMTRLMADHIGEVYEGHITRVRPFGLTVQLDTTLVEGTVLGESLEGGPYHPDARETALVGRTRSFAIGLPVTVKLVAADAVLGRLELTLVEPSPAS